MSVITVYIYIFLSVLYKLTFVCLVLNNFCLRCSSTFLSIALPCFVCIVACLACNLHYSSSFFHLICIDVVCRRLVQVITFACLARHGFWMVRLCTIIQLQTPCISKKVTCAYTHSYLIQLMNNIFKRNYNISNQYHLKSRVTGFL